MKSATVKIKKVTEPKKKKIAKAVLKIELFEYRNTIGKFFLNLPLECS